MIGLAIEDRETMMKPHDQPTFIFEAVGTRGERCRSDWGKFRANTPRHLTFSPAESMKFESYFYPGLDEVTQHFRELAEPRVNAVVVNIDKTCASNLLAEKHGFPRFGCTSLRSRYAPWCHRRGRSGSERKALWAPPS